MGRYKPDPTKVDVVVPVIVVAFNEPNDRFNVLKLLTVTRLLVLILLTAVRLNVLNRFVEINIDVLIDDTESVDTDNVEIDTVDRLEDEII